MKFRKCVSFLIIFLFLTGCKSEKTEEEKLYLSIKNRISSTINETTYQAISTFFTVDLNKGTSKKEGELEYFYNYSGGLYDKDENKYYYIDCELIDGTLKTVNGDEVYSYDPIKKETKKYDFSMVFNNFMFKDERYIYLVGGQRGVYYNPHALYKLDPKTGLTEMLYGDEDLSIRYANYNPLSEEFVFSVQSESEVYYRIDQQVEIGTAESPTQQIYTYKDGTLKYIAQTDNGEMMDIAANDSYIVYHLYHTILHCYENWDEVVFNGYMTIDRQTGETSIGVLGNQIDNLYGIYYLSADSSYMICEIYYRKESGGVYDQIVRYDFETGEITELFDIVANCSEGTFHFVVMKEH